MKPISKRLLIHDAVLRHPTGLDRNRNPVFADTLLKYVRVAITRQIVRGQTGDTRADTMTLYIDRVNTEYETADGDKAAAVVPEEQDTVIWDGKPYTVRGVTPCCTQGNGTVHHWETTLE